MEIHIGLSAFNNTKWAGDFYPRDLPRTEWFAYYCTRFDTYEINATFYRFPTVKSLKGWYAKSPEGFLFSVKAHKSITHMRRFEGTQDDVAKFYAACGEGLGEKLSCVLFQLPPSFHYDAARLEAILLQLDASFRNVVEFRHASWWRQEVFDALSAKGVLFCSVSYPNLPPQVIIGNGDAYVRMHGDPKLFYSEYGQERLRELAARLQNEDPVRAFVFFNNTIGLGAVNDALALKEFIRK